MILSLINGNVEYVEKKPRLFMLDSIITGLMGAITAVLLTYTRGRPDMWAGHAVFAMLLFFFYNVAREFMGYFSVLGSRPTTKGLELQYKILKYPVMIIAVLFVSFLIGLSFMSREIPDFTTGILKGFSTPVAFLIETGLFASILTVGETIVLFNHEEPKIGYKLLESLGIFTGTHMLLQFGGFYKLLYSGKILPIS
jgi:hypothetical protein